MLARFSPTARDTIVRAARFAAESGQETLGTGCLLWALAEEPLLGLDPGAVRDELGASPGRDRELLATLGIDLDEVRRRAAAATSARPDDPALWRLDRSPVLPLRVTLTGPAVRIRLDEGGRKAIEVALWSARRGRRPLAEPGDLIWGLLADGSSTAVRILHRQDADLCRIWTGLRHWQQAA
ncbi:Clp protease N-terminal domain-containing protein [Spirillospora sp. NPDC029432]|uniref:Clp protease N-terminal domain-containing protein n=1 Tax=Spirillospora sp. NPDC029432 TaxID=3154599 RepID=UPI003455537B